MNKSMSKSDIAVCFIWGANDKISEFCFTNMLNKNKLNVNYIVYSKSKPKCTVDLKNVEVRIPKKTVAETYNDFLNYSLNYKYAVIIPFNTLLNKDWLLDLKLNYMNYNDSGCISLKDSSYSLKLTSKVYDSEFLKTVYVDSNNLLKNQLFFSTDKIQKVGMLDTETNLKGLELVEWSFRFNIEGFSNFYIKYANCVYINAIDEELIPEITQEVKSNFQKILNEKIKNNNKI